MGEPLLTVREFADALRIKPGTVYTWIWQKKLAVVKISAHAVRIPASELDRLLSNATPAKSEN